MAGNAALSPLDRPVPMGTLVAFVDILGFKVFSGDHQTFSRAHGMLKWFCNSIDCLCQMPAFSRLRAYQGSDCVYVRGNVPSLMLRFVRILYQHCAANGVLLRGAMAGGNFIDLRDIADPFRPRSQAEFLPIWGDASSLAAATEGKVKGSRFLVHGGIVLDGEPPTDLSAVVHPDLRPVPEAVAADVGPLLDFLWPRPMLPGDRQAFNGVVGGSAILEAAGILQRLRAMLAEYQQAGDAKGQEHVQRTLDLYQRAEVNG